MARSLAQIKLSAPIPETLVVPDNAHDAIEAFDLGLIVDDRCALRVGNETRAWQAGKALVFCDATEHEAWNLGSEDRVVLLLDFRNPDFRWRVLNPDLTGKIGRYIREQWDDMSLREKAHYWAWRVANVRRRRRRAEKR